MKPFPLPREALKEAHMPERPGAVGPRAVLPTGAVGPGGASLRDGQVNGQR